jgi:DNA-binding CsgD family transcriptional regulator
MAGAVSCGQLAPYAEVTQTSGVTAVLGREHELALADTFLRSEPARSRCLLFEGAAGIGKTTLWLAGVQRARELAFRVLEARPAASERELSFAGLCDLFEGTHDAIGALPGPQRRALRIALLLDEADGEAPEPRAVGAAVLGLLRGLASEEKLLIAVDDAHWLDPPSTAAVQFALRRLEEEPVLVLASTRPDATGLAVEPTMNVEVGALDHDQLDRLIRMRLGVRFLRPTLLQLEEASGGNPFYALEIAANLARSGGHPEIGEPLPIPAALLEVVRERLATLTPAALEAALAAAAVAQPTLSLVRRASRNGEAGVSDAVTAGVLDRNGEALRFTHPLLASTLYEELSQDARRELHTRLAGVVEEPEERARQLAEAATGPDEQVASALEAAAAGVARRGAPEAATRLARQAVDLTPTELPRALHRRRLVWARSCLAAGDPARAELLLDEQLGRAEPGRQRAEVELELGRARLATHGVRSARTCFERALCELEGTEELELRTIAMLELADAHLEERITASDASEKALALAEQLDDPELLARALGIHGWKLTAGEAPSADYWERALRIEKAAGELRWRGPTHAYAWETFLRGDSEAGVSHLRRVTDAMRRRGDPKLPMLLLDMSDVARAAGAWEAAAGYADEAYEIVVQTGRDALEPRCVAYRARFALLHGDLDLARELTDEALALVSRLASSDTPLPPFDGRVVENLANSLFGRIAALSEDHEEAHRWFAADIENTRQLGLRDGLAEALANDIASLVAVGAFEEAAAELRELDELAEMLGPPIDALAARAHGLVAAREDLAAALAHLKHAQELFEALPAPWPFEVGKTLLALGPVLRRLKRRREARQTLEEARTLFERLGAVPWVERADAELRRISGRSAVPGSLTPAEERVAALVSEGKTNREVASALFLSDRTVEGHLSRVYRKLDVRSRAELTAKLASRSKTSET